METTEVGLYLFVTCVFASLLLSPVSPVRHFIGSAVELRALMGLAVDCDKPLGQSVLRVPA
jgi:hypothetical protein